jgi:hypothetical protein
MVDRAHPWCPATHRELWPVPTRSRSVTASRFMLAPVADRRPDACRPWPNRHRDAAPWSPPALASHSGCALCWKRTGRHNPACSRTSKPRSHSRSWTGSPSPHPAVRLTPAKIDTFLRRHAYTGGNSGAELLARIKAAPKAASRISPQILTTLITTQVVRVRVFVEAIKSPEIASRRLWMTAFTPNCPRTSPHRHCEISPRSSARSAPCSNAV